jgi:hypothetical protein
MSRWDITIAHPTNAIPPLVLNTFGADGYRRNQIQSLKVAEFSPVATALVKGRTNYRSRYTWAIQVQIIESQALQLEALIHLQDTAYSNFQDGYLLLTDEVEPVPPANPQPKTLLANLTTPYGLTYGFGVFKVKLEYGEAHRTHLGQDSATGEMAKLVQFSALELP